MRTQCAILGGAAVAGALFFSPAPVPALAAPEGNLRVLAVGSNRFEYVFASVTGMTDRLPRLAFNHVSGRTYFVHVGDPLGNFLVKAFVPRTQSVFNASLQTYQTKKSGCATLQGPQGQRVSLELGRPLLLPGRMALMVDLNSGAVSYVRTGDVLRLGPHSAAVTEVAAEAVTVADEDGVKQMLGVPSQDECARLIALWKPPPEPPVAAPVSALETTSAWYDPPVERRPARWATLTFDRLETTEVAGEMPVTAYAVSGASAGNRTGINVTPIRLTMPMPLFRTFSYSGSILVPMR